MSATYATCDGCSEMVALTPLNVLIAWSATAATEPAPEVLYRCVQCGFATRRQVEWRHALELARAGVNSVPAITLVPRPPDEVSDPTRKDPRPLTHDDLLDLHQTLTRPGWLGQIEAD